MDLWAFNNCDSFKKKKQIFSNFDLGFLISNLENYSNKRKTKIYYTQLFAIFKRI